MKKILFKILTFPHFGNPNLTNIMSNITVSVQVVDAIYDFHAWMH